MIDRSAVGDLSRVRTARGRSEILDAPGTRLAPLAFDTTCIPDLGALPDFAPNRFYACGVVTRLAQLAAAFEAGGPIEAAPVP
jgi:glutamate--cysteine ligase